jgi:hypothetical protein
VAVVRARRDLAAEAGLAPALQGVRGVLRDGGRCLVLTDVPKGGNRGRGQGPSPAHLLEILSAAGFRAARIVAARDGLGFVEAVHRRGE